ncbi:MAG: NADH-quinone oxidoreductase subunit L [Candidatus Paracaedibacteraceae bacterium]|nr:NADH-quinone oxidoreductase subunit L [Candidatus Paracaedibacteraceae bacterium]
MTPERLILCAVFAPFAGFLIAIIKRNIKNFSESVSIIGMTVSFFATIMLWYKTKGALSLDIVLMDWIEVGSFKVSWGIHIDPLVMVMIGVVNCVSFLVHVYSLSYMSHDLSRSRFMAYLSFFTFMMLLLVTAPNMAQLFVGWEGVGLASYLLIGFWSERPKASIAATKAFVVNRIGDVGLLLAMGALFFLFDSLDFSVILAQVPILKAPTFLCAGHLVNMYDFIGFFLLLGAMGKSAQFGLHVWLPDAMEGPTPVSALIHAATMVTAGIFLMARFSVLFELAPVAKSALLWVGIFTAFFGATVALTQNDIKRVIAYSTCSQLGYMMAACGCGAYNAAIFHLSTHAFFKALLFLGAGSVIHAMSDEQDMRKMGGIARLIPVTYAFMWIGSLALAGIPFFAGFYSKETILEALYNHHSVAYMLGLLVVFLTAFYSWRLLWMTFHGTRHANEHVMAHIHEPNLIMLMPLGVLSVGAMFSGVVGHNLLIDQTGFSWQNAIVVLKEPVVHLPFLIHALPLFLAFLGIFFAIYLYGIKPHFVDRLTQKQMYAMSYNKWWIDELYEKLICAPILAMGSFFWRKSDLGIIDRFGPNGIVRISLALSRGNRRIQTGYLYHYSLSMIVGILILSAILFIRFLYF